MYVCLIPISVISVIGARYKKSERIENTKNSYPTPAISASLFCRLTSHVVSTPACTLLRRVAVKHIHDSTSISCVGVRLRLAKSNILLHTTLHYHFSDNTPALAFLRVQNNPTISNTRQTYSEARCSDISYPPAYTRHYISKLMTAVMFAQFISILRMYGDR